MHKVSHLYLNQDCYSKSAVKCLTALITGIGVRPPIAHREADSIVSHKSFSTICCLARSCSESASTILSITSIPLTEPIRQGVHLPQDSTEQNSMEKRAIFAI